MLIVAEVPPEASPERSTPRWQDDRITTGLSDLDALMERVRGGDRAAFADLYDALAPVVFGIVRRVLRDPAMSEEVTQEVFVELWRTAPRYDRSQATVRTWAATMARRRAVDRIRHEESLRRRTEALGREPSTTAPDPGESVVVMVVKQIGGAIVGRRRSLFRHSCECSSLLYDRSSISVQSKCYPSPCRRAGQTTPLARMQGNE